MLKFFLHRREIRDSGARADIQDLRERLHRLEIARGELEDRHEQLKGHFEKLRSMFHGDRTPAANSRKARTPSPPGVVPLDEIEHGDKAALRRALAGMKHE